MKVELTKSQCKNVAEFINYNLLDEIRNDPDIDSVYWVKDMINAMEVLEKAAREGEKE